jgi:hypothetical protein
MSSSKPKIAARNAITYENKTPSKQLTESITFSKEPTLPIGWPEEVKFSNLTNWSHVPPELSHLRRKLALCCRREQESGNAMFKIAKSRVEGAGLGVFSMVDLAANTPDIMDFSGIVRVTEHKDGNSQAEIRSEYLVALYQDESYSVDIDASEFGNESRFINDYRRSGKEANCMLQCYFCQFSGEIRVAVCTIKNIKRGDELLLDYSKKYWKALRSWKKTA